MWSSAAWYRQLHWQIFIGMAAGVVVGYLLGEHGRYLEPVGDLFLRLLRMVIVPLIFSSLVVGTTSLGDTARLGRLGVKTSLYYVVSSGAAILVGLVAVNVIRPGVGADLQLEAVPEGINLAAESLGATLLNIVPQNPLAAMVEGNILGVIFFAVVVGIFTNRLPAASRDTITQLMQAIFSLMMRITHFVIRLAPLGVFALVVEVVGTMGVDVFAPLLKYMLTVILSLAVHAFITLPVILFFFARIWPPAYARAVSPALATAFSSASSSATLPLTLECVERRGRVPNQVSAFVLPLGATVNMDGTALYECVAAIFIAQAYGISLGVGEQVLALVTALLASIGAAGIPMAGLVMIVVVLRTLGLPLEGVGLILAVDRILDMCRTSVNVWSDTVGAAVIARWEGYEMNVGQQSTVHNQELTVDSPGPRVDS